MTTKCRAKNPTTCRTHGEPPTEALTNAVAEKNISNYLAVRAYMEKYSDNPSESEAYKETAKSVASYVYPDASLDNMTPERREEAEQYVTRVVDLAVQYVKPTGNSAAIQPFHVEIIAEEMYYARGKGQNYPYEVAKPEEKRSMKIESRKMLEGIRPALMSIPDQAPPRSK